MNRTEEITKAREADERIATAFDEYWAIEAQMREARASIKQAQKGIDMGYDSPYRRKTIADGEAVIEAVRPVALAALKAANDLDEALYTGWTRFFLVQHIHNTRSCSSFRATTRVGWLPSVSGLTEVEAVAEYGATLCTICFPSAPVQAEVVDPNVCTGTSFSRRYGRGGFCAECGQYAGYKSSVWSDRPRKHKKEVK